MILVFELECSYISTVTIVRTISEPMNEGFNPQNKPVFNDSPFSTNTQQSNIVQPTPECNFSFLKRENSYSLLKFLNAGDAPPAPSTCQSSHDQPLSNNNKNRHFPAPSIYHQSNQIKREASSIIKPAKLTTTASYQPLILKNELTTNWRDSQDSGLGNFKLYLHSSPVYKLLI